MTCVWPALQHPFSVRRCQRPGARYEVAAKGGKLYLTFVLDPMQAQVLGKPERLEYELFPVSETHFLMPSNDPLEDTQTVAICDFRNGAAQYLHTNCRVNPRARDGRPLTSGMWCNG
jgi:hypothetical protein